MKKVGKKKASKGVVVRSSKKATKKAAKKVVKKVTKKVTKKPAEKVKKKPLRTEKISLINTRTPKLQLAYAIGEKVYLKPGNVYTVVVRIYVSRDQIKYHCATGCPVSAEELEPARTHKLRGVS